MPSWRLLDAAQLAATHKYTFYRPSAATIAQVQVGETVKLIFEFDSDNPEDPAGERLWVRVDSIDGEGGFTGRLNDPPHYIADLKLDDPVAFRDIHIIQTEHDEQDKSPVSKYAVKCMASQRFLSEVKKVGYLWRDEPVDEDDSGWYILAGDETDAYLDDAANLRIVSLGAVLNLDDSILPLLGAPVGTAYERNPKTGRFSEDKSG